MLKVHETLLGLTRLMPEESVSDTNVSLSVHNQKFNNLVSDSFKELSQTDKQFKDVINAISQSPQLSSNPQYLLKLQNALGEYSNYVTLVGTLSRKVVDTISTLEKAQ